MEKFTEFLAAAGTTRDCVEKIDDLLTGSGCTREIGEAKSGYTVAYRLEDNRTLATFVCRKTGVKLRILPRRLNEYERLLDTFPDKMKKEIVKSSVCKRLIDPKDCNPKCVTGYDFHMDGERYRKCRYMAFMPAVTEESAPFILAFLKNELSRQE